MSHFEQLAKTDLQPLKQTEICGLVKKWKNANLIINIVIYLDVLAPINVFQYLSMGKLKCLTDESLVQHKSNMTHFTLLISKIKIKEVKHHYQGIKQSKYNKYFSAVKESYHKAIAAISNSMKSRFSDLRASPVFENVVDFLETNVWPEENFENFRDVKL